MRSAPADFETLAAPAIAVGALASEPRRQLGVDRLAVIVPCHNEAESLGKLRDGLERLRAALPGRCRLEVLLVDDGSQDGTATRMAETFADVQDVSILRHATKQGIAAAITTGLRGARSPVAASLDADCTCDPAELAAMTRLLRPDVDLVVASPYHPAGRVRGVPRWRLELSRVASRLYRALLTNKLHTYTSCVRVYRRDAVVDLPLDHAGFVGVVELLWRVDRGGGKIAEHPVELTARTTGCSKMRTAATTLAHLRLLARIALLRWRPGRRGLVASPAPRPLDSKS